MPNVTTPVNKTIQHTSVPTSPHDGCAQRLYKFGKRLTPCGRAVPWDQMKQKGNCINVDPAQRCDLTISVISAYDHAQCITCKHKSVLHPQTVIVHSYESAQRFAILFKFWPPMQCMADLENQPAAYVRYSRYPHDEGEEEQPRPEFPILCHARSFRRLWSHCSDIEFAGSKQCRILCK
jgi:hypothetical protein